MEIMKKSYTLRIKNKDYPVVITKKKIKRIIIKLSRIRGVCISCPNSCSDQVALQYLEKNRPWLEKAIRAQEENDQEMGISACLNYQMTYLRGKPYLLEKNPNLDEVYQIKENIIFYRDQPKDALEKLRKDYYSDIENEFSLVLQGFNRHITQKPFLIIRKMKSRWGSCNFKTGRITINRALIHVPQKLLHYVMIHEFAHLLYPNHSLQFRKFLKECLTDYRESEKELKKYAFLLQI